MKDANGIEVNEGDWVQIDAECGTYVEEFERFVYLGSSGCIKHGDDVFDLSASPDPDHGAFTFRKIELLPAILPELPSFEHKGIAKVFRLENPWISAYLDNGPDPAFSAGSAEEAQKWADAWQQVADHWDEYTK